MTPRQFVGLRLRDGKTYCRDKQCYPRSELATIDRFLTPREAGRATCRNCGVALAPPAPYVIPWNSTIVGAKP